MNESATPMTAAPATSIPEDVLIILPASDAVLFPGVVLPIAVHGKRALAAAQEAVRTQRRVGIVLQSTEGDNPGPEQLHRVGTVASIVRFVTAADGTHHLIAQGEQRFTVLDYVSREPFLVARIEAHKEPTAVEQGNRGARAHLARARHRSHAAAAAGTGGARQRDPQPSSRPRRWPTSWRASWTSR